MATPPVVITPVLKKEYLDMIPEFRGERELLPRFIEVCEKIVVKFYNVRDESDFQNEYLMSSILAKIKGDAAINIASCIITNWKTLKDALLNTYADKRDMYTLNLEMSELKQLHNESVFDFYNKLQHKLNLVVSYISTHGSKEQSEILCEYFRNFSLRVLLKGLKEPIGQLMRAKNPADLNSALNMLHNDFQFETGTKSYKVPINNKHNVINKFPIHNNNVKTFARPPQNTNFQFKPQMSVFPKNNFQNKTNYQTPQSNRFNFTRGNAGTTNKNNHYKPTPMSISTNNTFVPKPGPSRQMQSHNRPNFISEELFNIDQNSPEYDTVPDYEEPSNNEIQCETYENNYTEQDYQNLTEDHFLDQDASIPNYYPE